MGTHNIYFHGQMKKNNMWIPTLSNLKNRMGADMFKSTYKIIDMATMNVCGTTKPQIKNLIPRAYNSK